ncbi:MAG: TlpA family protein disulfide reductase [Candidatus Dormibacteraceae bacterium]
MALVTGNGYVAQLAIGPSLVIFVTQGCQPCKELLQAFNKPRTVPSGLQLLIIEPSVSGAESLRDQAAFEAHWAVDDMGALKEAFKARGTPHTFLVRDGHIVAQALGTNLRSLLRAAAQTTAEVAS